MATGKMDLFEDASPIQNVGIAIAMVRLRKDAVNPGILGPEVVAVEMR